MPATWESKLDELLDVDDGLSTWEVEFIESLDGRRGGELTEKQDEKLDQIWNRVFHL